MPGTPAFLSSATAAKGMLLTAAGALWADKVRDTMRGFDDVLTQLAPNVERSATVRLAFDDSVIGMLISLSAALAQASSSSRHFNGLGAANGRWPASGAPVGSRQRRIRVGAISR